MGSTRMPGKILKEFVQNKSILKIIIDNLKSDINLPIIVATTINPEDDAVEVFCRSNGVEYYRGDETNVLSRFTDIANKYGFTHCVRICADNPFLYVPDVQRLIDIAVANPEVDYVSYKIGEKPSILTHFGFWAELASVKALKIASSSGEKKYYEHVTNYIYSNPENFKIHFFELDSNIYTSKIRLTVDTQEDFKIVKEVYELCKDDSSPTSIINIIMQDKFLVEKMEKQILLNTK